MMEIKEFAERLKAFFSANFLPYSDISSGGCETCGYGGIEGMTLETIRDTIDRFVKEAADGR